jgi:hypothetical protein
MPAMGERAMTSWLRYLGGFIASALGRGRRGTDDFLRRGGVVSFRLLQSETLRSELGLSPEQTGQVLKFTREARGRRRAQFQRLRDQAKEKPGPQVAKLMREVAEEVIVALDKAAVLTPAQKERLRQITWQRQGAGAFADPHVQEVLGITPAQRQAIRAIVLDTGNRVGELRQETGAGPDGRNDTLAGLRKANQEKALAFLDEPQRARWDSLKGKPFDIGVEESAPAGPDGG